MCWLHELMDVTLGPSQTSINGCHTWTLSNINHWVSYMDPVKHQSLDVTQWPSQTSTTRCHTWTQSNINHCVSYMDPVKHELLDVTHGTSQTSITRCLTWTQSNMSHWVSYMELNQTSTIKLASIAQLGEHLLQSWEVLGSNPSQVQWVARSL